MRVPARARVAAACIAIAAGTIGAGAFATHAWGTYHWARTTAQFTLPLGDNLSGDWPSYLSTTSRNWNSPTSFGATSTPVLTAVIAGTAGGRRCGTVAGTTQVCNAKYGNNGWLGLATIYLSGDHITQGTSKMNDTYFQSTKYNNPNEKLHVMCQEVAHTFGLDHQSTDGSSQNTCMDYFSNTGANAGSTASTMPNAHDFEELNTIYAHLDSTTTVATSILAAAAEPLVTDDPQTWGALVRQSPDGRSSTYERSLGGRHRAITHVYWTEETASGCTRCDHRFYR